MSSSSLAISSRSSASRWAIGLTCPMRGFFWIVVISFSFGCSASESVVESVFESVVESVVEVARPCGRVDARLDAYPAGVGLTGDGGGELAGAQVADDALAHRQDALVADAHPAAARHQDPGVLRLLEDRAAAVAVDRDPGRVERVGAALAGHEGGRAELLGEQRQP